MAKFVPAFGSMSGKVGSLVFSHNAAGAYVRRWVIPVNPGTNYQGVVRGRMAFISSAWAATLTWDQREAWNAWASGTTWPSGGTKNGLAWFQRINAFRLNVGLGLAPDPPASNVGNSLSEARAVIGPASNSIVFAPTPTPGSTALIIEQSPPVKRSVLYGRHLVRQIYTSGPGVATPLDVMPMWTARFGAWPAGGTDFRIHTRVSLLDFDPVCVAYVGSVFESSSFV